MRAQQMALTRPLSQVHFWTDVPNICRNNFDADTLLLAPVYGLNRPNVSSIISSLTNLSKRSRSEASFPELIVQHALGHMHGIFWQRHPCRAFE
jgi:hypothetical protein